MPARRDVARGHTDTVAKRKAGGACQRTKIRRQHRLVGVYSDDVLLQFLEDQRNSLAGDSDFEQSRCHFRQIDR